MGVGEGTPSHGKGVRVETRRERLREGGRPAGHPRLLFAQRLGLQFYEFLFKYPLDYYQKQNTKDSDGSRCCGSTEHSGAIMQKWMTR
ncbi:hypothetical protein B296_00041771 [Ensete ventricosum]|uniref:Uncharacterized protein n=1 Tax=Ensete ventricosum TaxID=4639 RepID=A0A426Y847_ENSVE|nr:hypothetical protein B296_00041771 [Ensete ventricosum]